MARYGVPVLVSYAATEFGGGVAGWNMEDHRAFWARKRGSVGRAHAGCELRVVDPSSGVVARRPTRRACSRCGPASSAATTGCARRTWPASTPTGSCTSWGGPTRPSSAGASRSGPTTSGRRSSGTRPFGAPRWSARSDDRRSARCPSPWWSCGRARRRRHGRRAARRTRHRCWPATSSRRRSASSRRCPAPTRARSTWPT